MEVVSVKNLDYLFFVYDCLSVTTATNISEDAVVPHQLETTRKTSKLKKKKGEYIDLKTRKNNDENLTSSTLATGKFLFVRFF